MPPEPQERTVGFRPQFHPAHVFKLGQGTGVAGGQHQFLKVFEAVKATHRPQTNLVLLVCIHWGLAQLPRPHLNVLFPQGIDHILVRQAPAGHALGVEPQAHGVGAFPKNDHIADPIHLAQGIHDVEIGVVTQKDVVVAVILGEQAHGQQDIAGFLADGDPGLQHRFRQLRFRQGDPVLHVNGGDVLVAIGLKGNGDVADAVTGAAGGHVAHALHPVNLPL